MSNITYFYDQHDNLWGEVDSTTFPGKRIKVMMPQGFKISGAECICCSPRLDIQTAIAEHLKRKKYQPSRVSTKSGEINNGS